MSGFGERARLAVSERGRLCVGIDPHPSILGEWGLPAGAEGARRLGLALVAAARGRAGFVKPQVAFFERYGSAGYAALEEVLSAARDAGLLVIADAKRGDIGSTMDGYADAWLTPGSPLEADAVTLSPYLGTGALEGAFDRAIAHGKGVFVLAATSNPSGASIQRALADGATVAQGVVADVSSRNAARTPPGAWGDVGVVIGATVDWAEAGIAPFDPQAPILAPGFGHQGADPGDVEAIYGEMSACVIANESRSLLRAGPDAVAERVAQRAAAYAVAGRTRHG